MSAKPSQPQRTTPIALPGAAIHKAQASTNCVPSIGTGKGSSGGSAGSGNKDGK